MKLFGLVFCFLCLHGVLCQLDTYKAGIVNEKNPPPSAYPSLIADAAKSNADILLLPTPQLSNARVDEYDEIVKSLSESSKASNLYVLAHLFEKSFCQNKEILFRNSLVFDNQGDVVSVSRKPVFPENCNTTTSDAQMFKAFETTFVMVEEDELVLRDLEHLGDVRNVIVAPTGSENKFISASKLSASMAYVAEINLLTSSGVFAGMSGAKTGAGSRVSVTELKKNGQGLRTPPVVSPASTYNVDLHQHTIKPLDVEASSQGLRETLCDGAFCCHFYIKTTFTGPKTEANYVLAAFDGVHRYAHNRNIGVQECGVYACPGHYKRTCDISSTQNSTLTFDEISINGNFTKHSSIQYPLIVSADHVSADRFDFNTVKMTGEVTVKVFDSQVKNFGILGRDFSRDHVSSDSVLNLYDYIYNEDVQEFFDYMWIRIRILFVVVSIYVLEMM